MKEHPKELLKLHEEPLQGLNITREPLREKLAATVNRTLANVALGPSMR